MAQCACAWGCGWGSRRRSQAMHMSRVSIALVSRLLFGSRPTRVRPPSRLGSTMGKPAASHTEPQYSIHRPHAHDSIRFDFDPIDPNTYVAAAIADSSMAHTPNPTTSGGHLDACDDDDVSQRPFWAAGCRMPLCVLASRCRSSLSHTLHTHPHIHPHTRIDRSIRSTHRQGRWTSTRR